MSFVAKISKILAEEESDSDRNLVAPHSRVMHLVNNFSISVLLLTLILYVLVVLLTMFTYYEMWRAIREVVRIMPRNNPIVRDKFDVMKFTQW